MVPVGNQNDASKWEFKGTFFSQRNWNKRMQEDIIDTSKISLILNQNLRGKTMLRHASSDNVLYLLKYKPLVLKF